MAALALVLTTIAWGAWPQDVSLSGMAEHDGAPVVLDGEYLDLIEELGAAVAHKPLAPAETLGTLGFAVGVSTTFMFVDGESEDGEPTIWERARTDETASSYLFLPQLSVRKGLPFSLEVGVDAAWMGMSRQGVFGGQVRAALVEGYKPWPDLTARLGYSGYVGNEELELGVLDVGATFGSTFAFGSFPGIRSAQFSPYLDYAMLRIAASPRVDADVAAAVGAVELTGSDARILHQLGVGFQITNGTVVGRLAGTWIPGLVSSLTFGMGFDY